jgi:acetylornithine deacetylase/succinyl-diaminopimelate desuccinylase-like protein
MTQELVVDPVDLLEELVAIDSVNPAMGGPGEGEMVARLAPLLGELGMDVSTPATLDDGRTNLIAVLPGTAGSRGLLFEAHLDTVAEPANGISTGRTQDGLLGRGACDTKGSAAAMIAAIAGIAAVAEPRPTLIFAGVVDEEYQMRGSRALVEQLPDVGGAIVGEPTSLRPIRAHNGLVRFRVITHGRAAHTSRAQLGVNAVAAAARVVINLESRVSARLLTSSHPLTGPALLTAAVIHGGVADNIVPERCEVHYDRRLAPGEDVEAALAEIDRTLDELRRNGDDVAREAPNTVLPAVETPADHALVRLAEEAASDVLGTATVAGGVPYGTDASNLSGIGGIPCVVLGPGSIDLAHTDREAVPLDEVRQAAAIYAAIARRFAEVVTAATT